MIFSLEKSRDESNAILANILSKVGTNDGQKEAITGLCAKHRARVASLQAAVSTGEACSSSSTVQYFLEIGAHVVALTIANAANDKFFETIQETQVKVHGEKIPADQVPLRLHRWKIEKADVKQPLRTDKPALTGNAADAAAEYARKGRYHLVASRHVSIRSSR